MVDAASNTLPGVVVRQIKQFRDSRGWLAECFRHDELDVSLHPVMSYVSMTNPGIMRGPHEHVEQTDIFVFMGTTIFELYLWENRSGNTGFQEKKVFVFPENEVWIAIVPQGVVHGYKNVGTGPGFVLNYPNRLFAGKGKTEKIDEVRHENDAASPFKI